MIATVVETWRMPSGRIGTIDLDQNPGAIEVLRESLRDAGAVRVDDYHGAATARVTRTAARREHQGHRGRNR